MQEPGACGRAARLLDIVHAVDHAIAAQVVPGQAVGAHLQCAAHMVARRLMRLLCTKVGKQS